jgi:hypothetical protein
MTRQTSLPLDDPRWEPLNDALQRRCKQVGGYDPALLDLNRELAGGGLQSMVRRLERGFNPAREVRILLAREFWTEFRVVERLASDDGGRLATVRGSRRLGPCWFYVWLPDYKKIFPDTDAQPGAPAPMQEVPEKRGRKAKYDWPAIGHELVRRIAKNGILTRPMSTKRLADELGDWCEIKYKKAPVDSELRKFIEDVLRALKLPRR